MSVKIRLARAGSKKRPFYRIVAADIRAPRDGAFIEKLGTYNPLLPKDSAERFQVDADRIKHWVSQGAVPTEVVSRQLVKLGLMKEEKKVTALREKAIKRQQEIKKAEDAKKKAEEEAKAAEEAAKAAEEAANAAPEAPAEAEAAPETATEASAEAAPEEKPAE